jgi:E3 ubiquitin-protein ligase DOA10
MIQDYQYNRLYDDYNSDTKIIEDESNICFICFEYKLTHENKPIHLSEQNYYFKNCSCNGYIHNKCLMKWISYNSSCPICRRKIAKNTYYNGVVYNKYISTCINYMNNFCHSTLYASRLFFLFLVIFHIIIFGLYLIDIALK